MAAPRAGRTRLFARFVGRGTGLKPARRPRGVTKPTVYLDGSGHCRAGLEEAAQGRVVVPGEPGACPGRRSTTSVPTGHASASARPTISHGGDGGGGQGTGGPMRGGRTADQAVATGLAVQRETMAGPAEAQAEQMGCWSTPTSAARSPRLLGRQVPSRTRGRRPGRDRAGPAWTGCGRCGS